MVGRPYWSGQMKISLVSFGIQLYPAINNRAGVTFHQIDRESGQRIHHRNVVADDEEAVDKSQIVKGYEYTKGKYLVVEPDELAKLRIPSKSVIEIHQFVDISELHPALFEKPYFVRPDMKESIDAFAVVRKAMEENKKAAIGEIAYGGREHLIAIAVSPENPEKGLMAYILRYADELRKAEEYFADLPDFGALHVDKKQLAMANELVRAYSAPFQLSEFKDDYEHALRELIEAKQKNLPLPLEEEKAKPTKVINLMEALRESVTQAKRPVASEKHPPRSAQKKGPMLVGTGKRKRKAA
ncbi:MAG TPA: Ku protein [Terracidiphilus sp.]|nr:Ku protein [Terracidiphilus sp.]